MATRVPLRGSPTTAIVDSVVLSSGVTMPRLGFGTAQIPDGPAAEQAVRVALECGYRHLDTARLYRNEASVGRAVREGSVQRAQVFVTTKLLPLDQLRPERALEASLRRLGLDYVDCYLVHFPIPGTLRRNWRSMERLHEHGLARAVGVSNYSPAQLVEVLGIARVAPAVNQVAASPFGFDAALLDLCQRNGVVFEAHSPLTRARRLGDAALVAIARSYERSPAQICIRWALQHGMVVIPKSSKPERIAENADVFGFQISEADMAVLDRLGESARRA